MGLFSKEKQPTKEIKDNTSLVIEEEKPIEKKEELPESEEELPEIEEETVNLNKEGVQKLDNDVNQKLNEILSHFDFRISKIESYLFRGQNEFSNI